MSYHRGEPYVWADEEDAHFWSRSRDGNEDRGYASGVRMPLEIFDDIVARRFAELIEEGRAPRAILGAARKLGSHLEDELRRAVRNMDR